MTRATGAALRSARTVQVVAQAKINLRLRILAREASGFHQLETLLLRLELGDVIRVRRAATARTLDVTGEADPSAIGPMERNLAWRAALAYADVAGWSDGFAIELEKRIPIGGGLGGGSADAGAVLRALDAMAARPLGEAALLRIAFTLGADVPFLTSGHAYALAWGRGERLLALSPPPRRSVVLLVPSFGVSTKEAYGWLEGPRASSMPVGDATGILKPSSLKSWTHIAALAVNDFQEVVSTRHPEIAALVAGLRDMGCAPAMLSGSGSVVFGVEPAEALGVRFVDAGGEGQPTVRAVVTASADRVEPVVALD
ncbi:MAG: 4-(cytidine 5'-diphospho)-2-C-methyl-D-erythritol kinase [Gemmatimonadaceae bacterium]|nr:4-(cytidine 5'-diphospho)-2-C-methyl-D-erythritol kinase [Gemmatimonadaceae bacterium]NUO93822.1 4-(cytidine 5'-diphospho)-2-C-methyl-D-erythritol kinase [Gemmatimonadaceae bacterium]NUP55165.1 4-(cytidine 5'-diphospho)-2-C-methyl-D-erythritol kinase [Gemmatimonadaceae bacterium]NUP71218.1 4-(cytidine 5'-diphospho)-2-C-methyl-D-erythritol kinase [Gemmatimonadaceae bacterium]NUS34789.1 4-(cytidine 5'-diphospho)-2-C-methyl-D-erythritol kinase [Gemmatimonadaceae bacterium]